MGHSPENVSVISKLLEKTRLQKIDWKGTYESTTFICAIEGEYGFEIEKGKLANGTAFRKLTMKDGEQAEVFTERAIEPNSNSSDRNDQLFEILDELYDRARRNALDIEKKVSEASTLLDKL